ncbi:cysteine hydrolase family protein [Janibacter sp. Soil728]|uniref:cysteine hydrolase family protein n=1 Tax=Janibacter sp. Soil728 TaxID=1736393 RepID=UPI000A5FBE29|nr:isochorismatase family cysteine hydrolase [Janibacter sp. Soil728]
MTSPSLRTRAPWRAPLDRTALLVVDLQEAFFEDQALAAHREEIVTRARQVIRWAEREHLPIVNVRTMHQRDRSTWTITMLEDDQGYLFEGDDHTENLSELDLSAAIEVTKTRDDAFVGTDLGSTLLDLDIEAVVVIGVSTHTCVLLTAAHAFANDIEVVLVRDAIASHRPELHELTLDTLRDEYRFPVLSPDALCRVTASEDRAPA